MPVVSLVCPHCENRAQIQVTAVTRSRPCPHCGNTLLLQVAEKSSGAKRKAILVASTPPTDVPTEREEHPEPQALPGDVFERMCIDPSVQRLRRRLMVGGGAVAGLIVLLTVVQLTGVLRSRSGPDTAAASAKAKATGRPVVNLPEVLPIMAPRTADELVPIDGSQFMALANLGEPREVLQKFLEAASIQQRLEWVVAHDEVAPLMRAYYKLHGDEPVKFGRIQAHPHSDQGTQRFDIQITNGSVRTATLLKTPNGYRVDWPSFVAWGELAWEQFRTVRPIQPVLMRVLAAPADHYAAAFADPKGLFCVQLLPGAESPAAPVYGYLKRHSTMAREIEFWLQQADKLPLPLTLRIKYPPERATADQVWVTELVAPSWVVPARPAISRAP